MKLLFFIFLVATLPILSNSTGYTSYQKAYSIEKKYPLLSIPLYENALLHPLKKEIRETITARLVFLYDKSRKYPEFFHLTEKYPATISRKTTQAVRKKIAENIGISTELLEKLVSEKTRDNPEEISAILSENSAQKGLHYFILSSLLFRQKYDILEKIYSNPGINSIFPENRLIFLLKSDDSRFYKILYQHTSSPELSARDKAVYLYLYAMKLRNRGKYLSSSRYFLMSHSYNKELNGQKEACKSLIASGRYQEACELHSGSSALPSDSDLLLDLFCSGKLKKDFRLLQDTLQIYAQRENFRFYKNLSTAY